nr:hypothetical protein [Acetobacter senegalensis]
MLVQIWTQFLTRDPKSTFDSDDVLIRNTLPFQDGRMRAQANAFSQSLTPTYTLSEF